MEKVRLIAVKTFNDRLRKRIVPKDTVFYESKDRAASLIEKGLASISKGKADKKQVQNKELKTPVQNKQSAPNKTKK